LELNQNYCQLLLPSLTEMKFHELNEKENVLVYIIIIVLIFL
jgi:hypothetical protein